MHVIRGSDRVLGAPRSRSCLSTPSDRSAWAPASSATRPIRCPGDPGGRAVHPRTSFLRRLERYLGRQLNVRVPARPPTRTAGDSASAIGTPVEVQGFASRPGVLPTNLLITMQSKWVMRPMRTPCVQRPRADHARSGGRSNVKSSVPGSAGRRASRVGPDGLDPSTVRQTPRARRPPSRRSPEAGRVVGHSEWWSNDVYTATPASPARFGGGWDHERDWRRDRRPQHRSDRPTGRLQWRRQRAQERANCVPTLLRSPGSVNMCRHRGVQGDVAQRPP